MVWALAHVLRVWAYQPVPDFNPAGEGASAAGSLGVLVTDYIALQLVKDLFPTLSKTSRSKFLFY